MADILNDLLTGTYFEDEAELSEKSQEIITQMQLGLPKDADGNVTMDTDAVTDLLNEVIEIIRENRSKIDKKISYLKDSEAILQEEIDKFDENDIIVELKEENVNVNILNIANVEYTAFYNDVVEFKYRLGIVSYKKTFFDKRKKDLDNKMVLIQDYIKAINSV